MAKRCDAVTANVGAAAVIKATPTSTSWTEQRATKGTMSNSSRSPSSANNRPATQRTRSAIKKAYVRFDDYLDLNEENMRRSCKKIMNKLYCEPGNAPTKTNAPSATGASMGSTDAIQSAGSNVCRPQKSAAPLAPVIKASKSTSRNTDAIHPNDLAASTVAFASTPVVNAVDTNISSQPAEKSYLRSQYERRQKRQLELMNKMQRTQSRQRGDSQMAMNFNLVSGADSAGNVECEFAKFNQNDNGQTDGGANNNTCSRQQLQHQQDLVARSHELSKRRFFEKLERRESMKKNLEVFGTQAGGQLSLQQRPPGTIFDQGQRSSSRSATDIGIGIGVNAAQKAIAAVKGPNESKRRIFQEPVKHRERATGLSKNSQTLNEAGAEAESGDDDVVNLMPQVSLRPVATSHSISDVVSLRDDDTHGELSGPPTKSTPPPLPAKAKGATSYCSLRASDLAATNELIEFHTHLPPPSSTRQTSALVLPSGGAAKNNRSQGTSGVVSGQSSALIEFSHCVGQASAASDDCETATGASQLPLDKSAFEIKVPVQSPASSDQVDGRFLVVRQVEPTNELNASCCKEDITNLSLANTSSLVAVSGPDNERGETKNDAANAQSKDNKMPLIDVDALLLPPSSFPSAAEHKRDAAPSTDSPDNNDATCQPEGTIKVQSSDNQYQLQREAAREKVISAAISSIEQVNQAKLPADGVEMKRAAADCERAVLRTTSKSAADKNNSPNGGEMRAAAVSASAFEPVQAHEVDGSKSWNHECPEIKAPATQSADIGATNENNDHARIDIFNEPIALREQPDGGANCDAQAKQQVVEEIAAFGTAAPAPEVLANTVERGGAAVVGSMARAAGQHESACVLEAVAQVPSDGPASLETIITNEASARDVLPEANAKMLNGQIGSDESASSDATAAAPPLLPPLVKSVARNDAAKKVAVQVEASAGAFGRDFAPHGSWASKHEEIGGNDDQCGGGGDGEGSCELDFQQKRRLLEESLVERRHEQRPLLRGDGRQYANPRPSCATFDEGSPLPHHDLTCVNEHSKSSPPLSECENVHPPEEVPRASSNLIEPFYCSTGKSSRSTHEHHFMGQREGVPAVRSAVIEEDIRSSCSSSGFGASNSATGSSAESHSSASSSSSPHQHLHNNHHSFREKKSVPTSLGANRWPGTMLPQSGDQIYDVVRPTSGSVRGARTQRVGPINESYDQHDHQMASNDTYWHSQVGPDRAYPVGKAKGRPVLIENHGYASLVSRCQLEASAPSAFESLEFYSSPGYYANLPHGKMALPLLPMPNSQSLCNPPVEYATVRASSRRAATPATTVALANGQNGANVQGIPSLHAENKRHHSTLLADERHTSSGSSETDCDSSLSGRNNSLSSANSGGFSKLPPVRLIDHSFSNTLGSSMGVIEQQQQPKRPASLLKKFGSLVSRAFTSSGGPTNDGSEQQSATNSAIAMQDEQNDCEIGLAQSHAREISLANPATRDEVRDGTRASCNLKTQTDTQQPNDSLSVAPSVLAEADLVILPTKHSQQKAANQVVVPVRKSSTDKLKENRERTASSSFRHRRHHHHHHHHHHHPNHTSGHPGDRTGRFSRHRCKSRARRGRLSRSISISSGASSRISGDSTCSGSSLEYLSLISADAVGDKRQQQAFSRRMIMTLERSQPRRASSLSDELESLMNPTETNSIVHRPEVKTATTTVTKRRTQPAHLGEIVVKQATKRETGRSRISIDCVSPTGLPGRTQAAFTSDDHERAKISQTDAGQLAKSRSLLRWFGGTANSTHSLTSTSPSPRTKKPSADRTSDASKGAIKTVPWNQDDEVASGPAERKQAVGRYNSMNGFSSLMDASHATSGRTHESQSNGSRLTGRAESPMPNYDVKEPHSLIYISKVADRYRSATTCKKGTKKGPSAIRMVGKASNELLPTDGGVNADEEEVAACRLLSRDGDGAAKCQSLNIYQSLMRNYVRRHHRSRHYGRTHHGHYHGHNHSHGHHHQHNHNESHAAAAANYHHKSRCQPAVVSTAVMATAVRHAHSTSTRCGGTKCAGSLSSSSPLLQQLGVRTSPGSSDCCSSCRGRSTSFGDKSSVWGQLIKISKSDGSQVIELQRAPNKSWGFFVARGAINSVKGIFISRMHDSVTSSSLTGLLSIGDRILSIDNCSIEPDFDILRVNQMISKKSKIQLRVKPYKG